MRTGPKDFFLHLTATIFLYASVIALINLAFEIINRALPDALQTYYMSSSVVWPISILIVFVPVTYILEWIIDRDIVAVPVKKDLWIRRWRIYLTLFLTGVTIIVDLIALINTYLNGEITNRFIHKVLIILVVSTIVFAYYLLAKNSAPGRAKTWRSILMWLGLILVVCAIVGGFVIVGSPTQQRYLRLDQQRVSDLSSIQYQIVNYWQRTGGVPSSLQDLNDQLSNFTVPVDPDTHQSYEYIRSNQASFELCATFDVADTQSSQPLYPAEGISDNWVHSSGHTCFSRTIDARLYPVVPTPAVPK